MIKYKNLSVSNDNYLNIVLEVTNIYIYLIEYKIMSIVKQCLFGKKRTIFKNITITM